MAVAHDDNMTDLLRKLGYSDKQIAETTPQIATEIVKAAQSRALTVTVAKFRCLIESNVDEHITIPWDLWLSVLAEEPTQTWTEHTPGWSPVVYSPERRAKTNVKQTFGLVLDHDKGGDWTRVLELWKESHGLVYTTKSHGAIGSTGDRLRVVLPFARPVTAEEYERLWAWAARRSDQAGCPVDRQCKDVSRFWYEPTIPPGGWRAERLTGKPIDPDAILALVEPTKLRVISTPAPVSSEHRARRAAAYIARIPGAVSGNAGHTATFNAVAHVMIGFDLSPDDTEQIIAEHYNPRCDPPWNEREIRHKVRSVAEKCTRPRGYLLTERPRVETPQQAAEHAPAAPAELDVDWTSELLTKKDRTPKRAYHNTAVFVRHFPEYRGKWALDTMTGQPWFDGEPVRETTVHEIRAHIDRRLGYTPGTQDVEAAILTAAQDRPFNPILQYLRSLDWDGVPRLSAMAREYLGAEHLIHAVMLRKFMIGAAARALWPGCKLDTALMLVGPQGIGKSTFFATLGGPWHADTFVDITNKDSFSQIHSAWIYELSELENVVSGRAESRLKAWLTSTHDMFRAPYQRTAARKPRAVVICGTTNRSQFLTDDTGSRRFWIVPVARRIPRQQISEMRDQLWAEALCAAESGESWWLDEEIEGAHALLNREYHEEDPWHAQIADWLRPLHVTCTTTAEVLGDALKIDVGRHDRASQTRVGRVMAELGWKKQRDPRPPRLWRYVRPDDQVEMEMT